MKIEDMNKIAENFLLQKLRGRILRIPAVQIESGLGRSTIYLRISQGLWTRPVPIGQRSVGWPAGEVSAINAARIAGKNDEEIRTLVLKLEADRKTSIGEIGILRWNEN